MATLVVVPTYEEAENVPELLRRLRAANPSVSMLIVDDGSPDGTAEVAEAMNGEIGQVHVLRRSAKVGLGSAYRDGFRWGLERAFDVLVEMDADLSHDPAELPSLLAAIEDGADLAIGSRYVPGGSIPKWTLYRRQLSRWGNRYASAALKLGVRDATSGFRAYRAEILRKIDLGGVRADGYGFQIEMAYRVAGMGGDVREVPIRFRDRVNGQSKMSGKVISEALLLVTLWGLKDRVHHRRETKKAVKREIKRRKA